MGTYIHEFYPLQGCKGERMMSVLIGQSFRSKSVYFEIYKLDKKWMVYWNYEIPVDNLIQIMKKYGKKGGTLPDIIENETIMKEIFKLNKTYFFELNEDEITYFQKIIQTGLPELKEKIRWGFDGHHYEVKICPCNKEYKCWCLLPYEWKQLNIIIDILVDKAELNSDYRAYVKNGEH